MKKRHECWCLHAIKSIANYPAIRSYDEQAFDNMSEDGEKKNFIVKKLLRPVASQDE